MARQDLSALGFHQGLALVRHIAGTYPSLLDVLLELVQNSIDAGAKQVQVVYDEVARQAHVEDNGGGVSRAEFEEGLRRICQSRKTDGKYGRFGIGCVSPLGKCERFTFTSCPDGQSSPFLEWMFDTKELEEQEDELRVPVVVRPKMVYAANPPKHSKRDRTYVSWRTRVMLSGITTDRTRGKFDLDRLKESIEERFGHAIRKNKVRIRILFRGEKGQKEAYVRPESFSGKRLERVVIKDDVGGSSTFALYISPEVAGNGRQGKVHIGEATNPFRLSFKRFAFYIRTLGVSQEIVDALSSGLFEGEITSSSIKLAPNRNSFENDDGLTAFCLSLAEWYEKYGKKYVEEERERRSNNRLQQLGLRSLQTLEALFRRPEFQYLRDVIKSFRFGTTGSGHASTDAPKAGEQPAKSQATRGGGKHVPREESANHQEPERDYPEHRPMSVIGPQGKVRTLVRRDSLGLQLSHFADSSSRRPWLLDRERGVLYFNTESPQWQLCAEHGDECLVRWQDHSILYALSLEFLPEDMRQVAELLFDEMTPGAALLIAEETVRKVKPRK